MNAMSKTSLVGCLIFCLANFAVGGTAIAAIHTETVEYKDKDTVLEGFVAYDDSSKEKRPAVLVVHEWMGVSSYEKSRVEQLAGLGYFAMAVDVYGKGIRPKDTNEAAAAAGIYRNNRALMRERVLAGLTQLKKNPYVDGDRIAAIGYCFGGTCVLELARSGADIKGVVSFHGGLDNPNPEDAKNIKAKVLVLHGADDPHVPQEQVLKFQDEMRKAGVDWQMVFYSGAVHSFTNPKSGNDPSKGAAYNEKADRRSWEAIKIFFDELFKK